MAIITAALLSFLYFTDSGQQVGSVQEAPLATEEFASTELESILELHNNVTGLREIKGLLLHGSYIDGDTNYELDLSIRAPEFIRKKVRNQDIEITACSEGSSGSIKVHPTDGEVAVENARKDLNRYTLILEGATMRLTGSAASETWKYALISNDESATGKSIISSKGPSGIIITHLINKETGYELERTVEVRIDGTDYKLTLSLSDYRNVDNVCLPHHYALSVNGTIRAETTIESIRINPGLQIWMFSLN